MRSRVRHGAGNIGTPLAIRKARRDSMTTYSSSYGEVAAYSADYTSSTLHPTDTHNGVPCIKLEHPHGVGTIYFTTSVVNTETGQGINIEDDIRTSTVYTVWIGLTEQNITITVIG